MPPSSKWALKLLTSHPYLTKHSRAQIQGAGQVVVVPRQDLEMGA